MGALNIVRTLITGPSLITVQQVLKRLSWVNNNNDNDNDNNNNIRCFEVKQMKNTQLKPINMHAAKGSGKCLGIVLTHLLPRGHILDT